MNEEETEKYMEAAKEATAPLSRIAYTRICQEGCIVFCKDCRKEMFVPKKQENK